MDRKMVAIAVLAISAMLLTGVALQGVQEQKVQAQGGVYADYVLFTASISSDTEALGVLDTVTQRMIIFKYDINTKQLAVIDKHDVRKEIGE